MPAIQVVLVTMVEGEDGSLPFFCQLKFIDGYFGDSLSQIVTILPLNFILAKKCASV